MGSARSSDGPAGAGGAMSSAGESASAGDRSVAGERGSSAGDDVRSPGVRPKPRRAPVDPRLLRYARTARPHLVVAVLLALVITVSIVVLAVLLGRVLAGVITDPSSREFGAWTAELLGIATAVAVRAAATWWQARLAHRAGATVVAELESAVLRAGAELPPRELDTRRTELAVVVGNGLNGLRGWFTGYLPALLLACLVPPIVLVVIAVHDPTSALIAVITVPLIPLFMVLIGLLTQGRAEATLAATTRLSDQLLDLFAGMPTLRALGREGPTGPSMVDQVRALGDSLRQRTMRALRMAFLSSMVLESLATLSVALIAVAIGLRLVYGEMTLYAGLVALILAPEVYWPLRQVGEKFHAAQDGMAAADKAFAVLDSRGANRVGQSPRADEVAPAGAGSRSGRGGSGAELGSRGGAPATSWQRQRPAASGSTWGAEERLGAAPKGERGPGVAGGGSVRRRQFGAEPGDPTDRTDAGRRSGVAGAPASGSTEIVLRELTVAARAGHAPDRLSAVLAPGTVTVLTGPNGCGKSTTLHAILGLIAPDAGVVRAGGIDVRELDQDSWWGRIAWLPQRPVLVPGTLRDNVELLGARTDAAFLDEISAATGFDRVLADLPDRWDTVVGQGGVGLSLGERQRLALTRVLAARRPILLLDEPTAHLDSVAEQHVLTNLRALAAEGATVVIVGHRPTVLAAGDIVVQVAGSAGTPESAASSAVRAEDDRPYPEMGGLDRPGARTSGAADPSGRSPDEPAVSGCDGSPGGVAPGNRRDGAELASVDGAVADDAGSEWAGGLMAGAWMDGAAPEPAGGAVADAGPRGAVLGSDRGSVAGLRSYSAETESEGSSQADDGTGVSAR